MEEERKPKINPDNYNNVYWCLPCHFMFQNFAHNVPQPLNVLLQVCTLKKQHLKNNKEKTQSQQSTILEICCLY